MAARAARAVPRCLFASIRPASRAQGLHIACAKPVLRGGFATVSCRGFQAAARACRSGAAATGARAASTAADATGRAPETDLSTRGTPLGDVFDACPPRDGPLQFTVGCDAAVQWSLTPDQVAQYEAHGYVSGVNVLSDTEVDTLLRDYATFLDPDVPPSDLWHEFHRNESSTRAAAGAAGGGVGTRMWRGSATTQLRVVWARLTVYLSSLTVLGCWACGGWHRRPERRPDARARPLAHLPRLP